MRILLFWSFAVLSFLMLILALFQNIQLSNIKTQQSEIQLEEQKLALLNQFSSDRSAIYKNPIFWDTIHFDPNRCKMFSPNELSLIQSIETSLAKIGYKENGYVGQLRTIAHTLEKDLTIQSSILAIRRYEKDFLLRKDSYSSNEVLSILTNLSKQINNDKDTHFLLAEYEKTFLKIKKLYEKLFIQKENLIGRLDNKIATQQEKLRNSIAFKSARLNTKLTYTSRRNLIFSACLISISLIFSFYVSKRLSNSIVELQQKMKKYILSEYDASIRFDEKLPKNELGSIMLHFMQLTKKITQDIHTLEARVKRRTKTIEEKHALLEQQHEEILQGMRYAKDIQRSLLPNTKELSRLFPTFQLFFQPKDLVGGDFYWGKQVFDGDLEYRFLAIADCTGHGIPGALLGTLGLKALEEIVHEKIYDLGEILNNLRWYLSKRLNKNARQVQDGMDIAIICHNVTEQKISFSGANLDCWIIRDNSIIEIRGDRMFVGWSSFVTVPFQTIELDIDDNDQLLLFTDGLIDQFGGEYDKKWSKKRVRDFILKQNQHADFLKVLDEEFNSWKGDKEQTDDCTAVCFRPKQIQLNFYHINENKLESNLQLSSELTH